MKKLLFVALLFMLSVATFAQTEVTKFLGIPVDGTKPAMIQKLKAKGFRYDAVNDCLKGEFNGRKVIIKVVTNNNKVYRIAVVDENNEDEGNIKIRFNTLVSQFEKNKKYVRISDEPTLSDKEDISFEMTCHNKRYEADYYQLSSAEMGKNIEELTSDMENRSVWFMIDRVYGKYRILMFYDNGYNQSDGEDL